MTNDELAELIEGLRRLGGDDADVEVKRAERALPKTLRETVSAFANARGGIIILGLDEAQGFQAIGVEDPAKMAADLASMCSDEMEPPVRPLIKHHIYESASLVVAEIPETDRSQKPCYYKGAGMSRGSYLRVSDGDRRLSSYEIQMTMASRGQPREDEQPAPGATR